MKKLILINSITISIILILFAIFCELFLRHKGYMASWTEKNGGEYSSPYTPLSLSEPWIFRRTKNLKSSYNQPEFNFELITNSLGIRDIEHRIEKNKNEIRIIVLGDSFTEGQGTDLNNSWPKILEKKLNLYQKKLKTTIIMGGVAGSDPIFSYQLFKKKLLKYQPDLVLLAINNSDIGDIMTRGGLDRFLNDGSLKKITAPKLEKYWKKSHLFRAIMFKIFRYNFYLLSPKESRIKCNYALNEIVKVALEIKKLGNDKFDFILVGHPLHAELYKKNYKIKNLFTLCEKNNIKWLDIKPDLLTKINKNNLYEYYWQKDQHFNKNGYQLFALSVYNKIINHTKIYSPNK